MPTAQELANSIWEEDRRAGAAARGETTGPLATTAEAVDALARKHGLKLTRGYRSPANREGQGLARDYVGSPQAMLAFTREVRKLYGDRPELTELFHTPAGNWKHGQPVQLSGPLAQRHHNQVHLAWSDPGSVTTPGPLPAPVKPGMPPPGMTTLDQMDGRFQGTPQIGSGITPRPQRGVALTSQDAVKRAQEIAATPITPEEALRAATNSRIQRIQRQPGKYSLPERVPPAQPGAVPTMNQLMQEFTGTPYGPTGEAVQRAQQSPQYRFAGPDTFNPATWDVHKGRTDSQLWTAYALAAFTPIAQARGEKLKGQYSGLEKTGHAAPPPLLSSNERVKAQQLAEIQQVKPDFESYVQGFGKQFSRKFKLAQEQATTDLNLGRSPGERHAADERWNAKRQELFAELAAALDSKRVQQEMYRRGHQLTALQKQALASSADYTLFAALNDEDLANGLLGDILVNYAAGKIGEWAGGLLIRKFPWLGQLAEKATARLAIKQGESEGIKTFLKRGAKGMAERVLPSERSVSAGISGSLQQSATYALTEEHPTAKGLIQSAAIGFVGGAAGDRTVQEAIHGLGLPGRWLARWAEANPSVPSVRKAIKLLADGEIRFPRGASEPVFSLKAQQVLGKAKQLTGAVATPMVQNTFNTALQQRLIGAAPAPATPPPATSTTSGRRGTVRARVSETRH